MLSIFVFSFTVNAVDQDVTIHIDPINELSVSSGSVTLNINTADAGSGPVSVTDTSTTMSYTTNEANKKITAKLSGPYDDGITLKVEVESASGNSQGQVELGTTAADIITGLGNAADQNQQITYTATASVDAEPDTIAGGQGQTVTFTITG